MAKNDKQTDILITLGQEAELWHTSDHRTFATVDSVRRNLEIDSAEFRRWLEYQFWVTQDTAASAKALARAREVLSNAAQFEGAQEDAFIRVGQHNDSIYLDLGDDDWQAVEVTPEGWRTVEEPPVRFCRSPGQLSLPEPQPGGSIADLRPFVNVRDQDFVLVVAWLIGALNPKGPYPIALIQGEQGSAKSTLTRVLRSLVDPATPTHGARPNSERDYAIAAHNSWIQAFDNLSEIPAWLSDAFCRMATGGGFKTRKLYTDTAEIILEVCRPQILNGIEDLATRDDLRDRGILFELPVIAPRERRREHALWEEFEQVRPYVLGALLDAVSTALREQDDVTVEKLPRMADFASWVVAAEKSLPWVEGGFLDAYEQNRRDAISLVLDHSSLAQRIIRFAEREGEWEGTPTALYNEIARLERRGVESPATPAAMSQELKRIAPALRQVGIEVEWDRENDRKRTRKIAVRAVHAVRNEPEGDPDDTRGRKQRVPVGWVDGWAFE